MDVQEKWQSPGIISTGKNATAQWALGKEAERALCLLPPEEHEKTLRFYRIADAKLCLGSYLLKHCAIAHTCNVPWSETSISADKNRKPCYIPSDGSVKTLEFNVSHHGTLVALVGCISREVGLGIDIVQMNWAKDIANVNQSGWPAWVRTYEAVFSASEVQDIISWKPSNQLESEDEIKAKIRHFYAHWCLKEAYVKMTGEALMAPWLQDMEFKNVNAPQTASTINGSKTNGDWGEIDSQVEIWHSGERVTNVKMELQAFRNEYMIATAVSKTEVPLAPFKELNLQRDVLPMADPL